jgi:hypothetical protein
MIEVTSAARLFRAPFHFPTRIVRKPGGGFTGNMFGIMKLVQNRGPSAHARTPNQHRGNLQGYPAVIRSQGLVVA